MIIVEIDCFSFSFASLAKLLKFAVPLLVSLTC